MSHFSSYLPKSKLSVAFVCMQNNYKSFPHLHQNSADLNSAEHSLVY